MPRRRFIAPRREAVDASVFEHPAFAPYAGHLDLLRGPWPALDALNERFAGAAHPASGVPLRFVAQSQALLRDGLHYEQRIHDRGEIATREHNWHDLLNALAWLEFRETKGAMNQRQVADIARTGPSHRTRAQYALTQFDEAGAVVVLRDDSLLGAWDRHDWHAVFADGASQWRSGAARVVVFGHALLEHLLADRVDLVARCVVVLAPCVEAATAVVAGAIASGEALADPQALRPLPLCGLPGWHPGNAEPGFHAEMPCFAPARSGEGIRPRGAALRA